MKQERRAALLTLAAMAGTAFYPGRLKCLFFAQLGWASWIAILVCALLLMMLLAGACKMAKRATAGTLGEAYLRHPMLRGGAWLGAIHAIYLILTAIWMLMLSGRAAERVIPLRAAFPTGVIAALLLALCLGKIGRVYPIFLLAALAIYALILALDPRPINYYRAYQTESRVIGSMPTAMLLACLYASANALNGSVIAVRYAREIESPIAYAALSAAGMLLLECAENAPLQRAGTRILAQAEPFACLAARWGKGGYYATNALMAMCACATLATALSALFGRKNAC